MSPAFLDAMDPLDSMGSPDCPAPPDPSRWCNLERREMQDVLVYQVFAAKKAYRD